MSNGFQSGEQLDELPGYIAPRESLAVNSDLAAKYPLNVISPKSHGFLNSCYANMENKIKGQVEQFVLIYAADAQFRGIKQGDTVRVFNNRGGVEAVANITDEVSAGIVVATFGLLATA